MTPPAPAFLDLRGLRTVIYPAPDLAGAKAWWTSILGVDPYFDQPFYVGFTVSGYELGLLPEADPQWGAQVYWGVEDVANAIGIAVAAGATIISDATDVGDSIVTGLVRTPQGSLMGLIANPHFKLPVPNERRTPS